MIIRVIDFETTGLPPDAAVCEVGWCDVKLGEGHEIGEPQSVLVNPGRPIPVDAMAVHHITDADVRDAIGPTDALANLMAGADVFAAHKAAFEQAFFAGGDKPWICTWKIAIRLAPRAPGHSNQILRYWLNLEVDRALAAPPHRAGPDAYVTAHLLARMLAKMPVADMVAMSSEPAILPYFLFGKHAMKPIEEVDAGYLDWVLKQDFDADVKHTARHHLKLRTAAA